MTDLKMITLTHYLMKGMNVAPWEETFNNLVNFCKKMMPKFAPLGFGLKLRQVELDDYCEENLASSNLVSISCEALDIAETPIEKLLFIEPTYTDCADCVTPNGFTFPVRTFTTLNGETSQTVPEEFFMEAVLKIIFRGQNCDCSCENCASGCGNEAIALHREHHKHSEH